MDERIMDEEAATAFYNMRGDGDMSSEGYIELDRSQPLFPVIRFKAEKLSEISADGGDDDGDGGDGDDDDNPSVVTEVNSAKGSLAVIGGVGVKVTTNGRTIRLDIDQDKTKPDEDPNVEKPDPCAHPGDPSNDGGVAPYASSASDGGAAGPGGIDGGVSPGSDDVHPGDDKCNCPS